ncbi:hypothetical protein [Fimbriimonas ginsengisoli]|uniref:Uncharacterized protein n=1 Tax=Fimbriimonas ginsengisoli Gsoil 348 TaxID=661478 RepID=A0A068NZ45_FIMGI|nr:hypothetical protein [Fimbriimonas ginsengisoli]AIE87934.1 hypothetical protein OP10G_4566 [Fimbriimonas ginsengisoli Gsoil 348]
MPSPAVLCLLAAVGGGGQSSIPRVDLLPDRPTPYILRDWRRTASAFDRLVFDLNSKGPYLPLVWRVPGVPNLTVPGFGMPSYVGKEEMRGKPAEAIAALGSLLGATAIGIDKRSWVELTPQYLNPSEETVLNNVGGKSGSTFWYELLPSVVFTQLASRYPAWHRGGEISRGIADAWVGGIAALHADFDHTSYDFAARRPVDNGQWKEPDAAAAVAYLELFQGLRGGQAKYLTAARKALNALQIRETNPTYEVLTAYGALAGAYLNAEKGERWDVPRWVDWCFDPTSPNRTGWGMIAGRWGGYDVGGLMGSTNDGGGYAFAMNTFLNAATLAPVARYDDRFSAALAKWILNLSNASRLFYRDSLPGSLQSSADWTGDPQGGIAYEGLRRTWEGKSPYATGDSKRSGWGKTDFGIYGGGYVGLLAALVHPTSVPMILRIDLRATDFLPVKGYPTDLYWNPYESAKSIRLELGPTPVRLYDAVSNRFLAATPVKGAYRLHLSAKQSVQVVRVPATGRLSFDRNRSLIAGVPIDYNNGRVPLPPRVERARRDLSVLVRVPQVGRDGTIPWNRSQGVELSGGEGSKMRAELRFAWDKRYLHFRLDQRAPSTATIEAPNVAELRRHWWDFEDVVLSLDFGREKIAVANVPEVTVGWSSRRLKNLAFSPDLTGIETTTNGTASASNRIIFGKIAWTDLYRASGVRMPLNQLVKAGAKIGCQPLLVDGTFKRQAYIGGARYTRPTGFDKNSRTLVLEGR